MGQQLPMSVRIGFPDTIKFTSAIEELALAFARHYSVIALAMALSMSRFNRVYCY